MAIGTTLVQTKTMMLNLSSPLFFEFTIRLNNTALSIKGSIFLYDKIRFSSCLNIIAIIDLFASFVIQMILQQISVILFYMDCTSKKVMHFQLIELFFHLNRLSIQNTSIWNRVFTVQTTSRLIKEPLLGFELFKMRINISFISNCANNNKLFSTHHCRWSIEYAFWNSTWLVSLPIFLFLLKGKTLSQHTRKNIRYK